MTTKTFKTKNPILVETFKQTTTHVFLDIESVSFDFDRFTAYVAYYYFDENGNRIELNRDPARFSIDEGRALQDATGPLSGEYLDEMYLDIIIKATMFEFSRGGYFNLTAADWELVQEDPE